MNLSAPARKEPCTLVDLMFSAAQQRLLAKLLLDDARSFTWSELNAAAGAGKGGGAYALQRLCGTGLINDHWEGNQHRFSANTAHPLYAEMRAICVKSFGVANLIARALSAHAELIETAFIFGSYAKSATHAGSDIDLFVVSDLSSLDLYPPLDAVEQQIGRSIDLNVYSPAEMAGFAADGVIGRILQGPKIDIIRNHVLVAH